MSISEEVDIYQCQYCKKSFKRENSLVVHMCEPKRRYQSKDNKDSVLGLQTYVRFYKYAQNVTKSFDDFVKSPYYLAFIKFGRYCYNTKCINVEKFIDFVIVSGIKLDNWATDDTYSKYLQKLIRTEPVEDAVCRAIEYSIKWSEEKKMESKDLFRYGNSFSLCYAITTGKISPWVIYQSKTGQKFLENLSQEQLLIIWEQINPDYWKDVFARKKVDVEYVQNILLEMGW